MVQLNKVNSVDSGYECLDSGANAVVCAVLSAVIKGGAYTPLSAADTTAYENRLSDGNLAQDSAQFVKVHRLAKMEIEPGLLAALNVLDCAKAGERYRFNRSFSFSFGNHVVTAAIGQRDVAQKDVELFGVDNVQRGLRAIGNGNFVAEMTEETRQCLQCVAVIFDHQDTQTLP